MIKSFRDLLVWQKSMDMVLEVYRLVKKLPKEELYCLSSQLRRSAVSVPSNIAEGQQRKSTREFINFLSIARGSNAEVQTQLLICNGLNYLSKQEIQTAMQLTDEIGRMLNAIIDKLSV